MRFARPAALAVLVGVVASVGDAEHDASLNTDDVDMAAKAPVGLEDRANILKQLSAAALDLGDLNTATKTLDEFERSVNALKHLSTVGVYGWDSFVNHSEFAATQAGLLAFRKSYRSHRVDDAKLRTQHEALVAKRAAAAASEKRRREAVIIANNRSGSCLQPGGAIVAQQAGDDANETYSQESRSLKRNKPKYQKRMIQALREKEIQCDLDTSESALERFAIEKISRSSMLSITNKVIYFVGDDTVSDLVR